MPRLLLTLIWIFFLTASCSKKENPKFQQSDTLFKKLESTETGVKFKNQVRETINRNIGNYDYFYNGGGVALGDINNDGLEDIFFTGNDVKNKLFLNNGFFNFEDITESAGLDLDQWCTGVSMADINGDGYLDIYVCVSGPDYKKETTRNKLYINQGNSTFVEEAKNYGVDDNSLSTQAAFFDMDNDGDLDLWVLNHAIRNWGNLSYEWMEQVNQMDPETRNRFSNTLYRNEGNGKFKDVSTEAGINEIGFGLGIAISDLNQDGLLDVYIANDYFIPDKMFTNQGNGKFIDQLKAKVSHSSFYSMGCDAADINNDSWPDLAVLDMTPDDHYRSKMLMSAMDVDEFRFLRDELDFTPQYMFNSLMINNSNGIMSDIGHLAGIAKTDWSWCPLLADFDNDGSKDLYVSNGIKKEVKNNDWRLKILEMKKNDELNKESYFEHLQKANAEPIPNAMFQNKNGYEFEETSENWGLKYNSFSNGAAYGDLDNDGDLDLVVNNIDDLAFVFKNFSRENESSNYIQLQLKDTSGKNRDNGARVKVKTDQGDYFAENFATRGFQSQSTSTLHFGLKSDSNISSIEVVWRDGKTTTLNEELNPNSKKTIDYAEQKKSAIKIDRKAPRFLNISSKGLKFPFKHKENAFDDYRKEILLPHSQSMLGPGFAVGDINNDGLEDFYIGGAKDQESMLYVQVGVGFFDVFRSGDFIPAKASEETGALFFDYNGDGLQDLYVACGGGGDLEGNVELLQDKLYKNKGGGRFELQKLPKINSSTMAIQTLDWDNDGDLDLFVGGRTTPGNYPLSPKSYFLQNNNGVFVDVSKTIAPFCEELGMVTDVEIIDWNNDGTMEMIVVGEWMPITILDYINGSFQKLEDSSLKDTQGWWYSITKGDIDNDGDDDLIVGNIGRNNKFHPTIEKPLYCYANDFDKNGVLDIVLSKEYKEKLVPVRGRECSSTQMPFIAEEFSTYDEFATADLDEIYGIENIKESYFLEAKTFSSVKLLNTGGEWEIEDLPIEYQISPINGAVVYDFNKDQKMDLVTGGNYVQTEVETTPYDAGKGSVAFGNSANTLKPNLLLEETGMFLFGDIKGVYLIKMSKDEIPAIIATKNNGSLGLFLWNQ